MTDLDDADDEARRARCRARMLEANSKFLQREYAAAGIKPTEAAPGIPVSLALANNLKGTHT